MDTTPRTYLVVSFDDDLVSRLTDALHQFGSVLRSDPSPSALQALMRSVRPDAVLLDVGVTRTTGESLPEQIRRLRALDDSVRIVAIGDEFAAQTVLLAMRAGAQDFIERDSSNEEFAAQIVAAAAASEPRALPSAVGRIIGVFSGRPNDGEAATALGTALTIAQRRRTEGPDAGRVLYLDLAEPCSDIEVALDVRPAYGVRQAMVDLARLDQTLLDGVAARHAESGLYLLPLALGDTMSDPLRPGSLPALLFVLRALFSDIVVNFGGNGAAHDLASITPALASAVVVVRQEMASTRACAPLTRTLGALLESQERMVVAVADHDPRIGITQEQITRALGGYKSVTLPEARVASQNAIATGRFAEFVRKNGPAARAIAGLLGAIASGAPVRAAPKTAGKLAGLLRRRPVERPGRLAMSA